MITQVENACPTEQYFRGQRFRSASAGGERGRGTKGVRWGVLSRIGARSARSATHEQMLAILSSSTILLFLYCSVQYSVYCANEIMCCAQLVCKRVRQNLQDP